MRWFHRHRFRILLLIAFSVLAARIGLYFLFPESSRMLHKYEKIRNGMTVTEVEEILGKPNWKDTESEKGWSGSWGNIVVMFQDGRVSDKAYLPAHYRHPQPRFDLGQISYTRYFARHQMSAFIASNSLIRPLFFPFSLSIHRASVGAVGEAR
jgi:hypothetical protein